jgi:4-amino-4-deoxy-L-arabinose transferase-like glycosyltransferase
VTIRRFWPATIVVVVVGIHLATLDRRPAVWFDEGFRFNAARVLAETGTFGSRSASGVVPFDQSLTSGPLEVTLVALSFSTLGRGVAQGRLPFLLLAVASLALVWRIGARVFGRRAAAMMVLTVVAAPPVGGIGLLWLGRQALSETPALAMLLLGLSAWVRSLRSPRASMALLAGASFGVAVLSKSQFAIAVVPAMAALAIGRWASGLDSRRRAALPTVGFAMVTAIWWAAQQLLTPLAIRDQNADSLWQGVQANILTGLWGATLDRGALLITATGLLASAWGLWLWRSARRRDRASEATWTLAALISLTAANTLWFAVFSNGWPRYGYLGYVTALMLIGVAIDDAAARLAPTVERRWPGAARTVPGIVTAALALAAVPAVVAPTLAGPPSDGAARMAEFIEMYVPVESVVETWEWELSGIGAHTAYHFPEQKYVYLATYQQSRSLPYRLPYDALEADPEYLVTGPFSTLTGIYPESLVAANFAPWVEISPYTLYARRR